MSASYEAEWRARFGEEPEAAPDLPDLPWLRQVLMRRTHRRYAERPVPEPLLRLLLGTAFSASSKSDFQQATVIWVRDRGSATVSRRWSPTCRGSATRRCFWSFAATRTASSGSARCAATPARTASSKGFSTPRSTRRWSCRPSSWRPKPPGLGCCPISVIRNHADAVAEILGLPDKVFPVAGLCVGYPAAAGHISMRLPLDGDRAHRPLRRPAASPKLSMPMTGGAMRDIRCRASSSARPMSSATRRFTAGRRTRRGRRRNPKARVFRAYLRTPRLSPWIDRTWPRPALEAGCQRLHSARPIRANARRETSDDRHFTPAPLGPQSRRRRSGLADACTPATAPGRAPGPIRPMPAISA